MRGARGLIASLGAGGSLVGAGVCVLLLISTVVAFRGGLDSGAADGAPQPLVVSDRRLPAAAPRPDVAPLRLPPARSVTTPLAGSRGARAHGPRRDRTPRPPGRSAVPAAPAAPAVPPTAPAAPDRGPRTAQLPLAPALPQPLPQPLPDPPPLERLLEPVAPVLEPVDPAGQTLDGVLAGALAGG